MLVLLVKTNMWWPLANLYFAKKLRYPSVALEPTRAHLISFKLNSCTNACYNFRLLHANSEIQVHRYDPYSNITGQKIRLCQSSQS